MLPATLACPRCSRELPAAAEALSRLQACPYCRAKLEIVTFPAFDAPLPVGPSGELIVVDGEAGCFYHPKKRAVVPCDACGRFLCPLCDLEMDGRHLCPNCVEKGSKKGDVHSLERGRVRYDSVALTLSIVPILFYCACLVGAPAALFVVARYWKAPPSLVERTRVRMIVAAVLAVIELVVATAIIIAMFNLPKL